MFENLKFNFEILQSNSVYQELRRANPVLYDEDQNASSEIKVVNIFASFYEQIICKPTILNFGVVAPLGEVGLSTSPLVRAFSFQNPSNHEQIIEIIKWSENRFFDIPGKKKWSLRPGEKVAVPVHFTPTKHLEQYETSIEILQHFEHDSKPFKLTDFTHIKAKGLGSLADVDLDTSTPSKLDFQKVRIGKKRSKTIPVACSGGGGTGLASLCSWPCFLL